MIGVLELIEPITLQVALVIQPDAGPEHDGFYVTTPRRSPDDATSDEWRSLHAGAALLVGHQRHEFAVDR